MTRRGKVGESRRSDQPATFFIHQVTLSIFFVDRIDQLLTFLKEDPDDAFTRFALAQEYARNGNEEAALTHYEALLADHPGYLGTYYHLGQLYRALDREEEAVATFQAGIAEAGRQNDLHTRSELQNVLMNADAFDDE